MGDTLGGTPLPYNSGILGIYEDPNILIILYSNYYWVGGPPKRYREPTVIAQVSSMHDARSRVWKEESSERRSRNGLRV